MTERETLGIQAAECDIYALVRNPIGGRASDK